MTVADMIAQRTEKLSAIKDSSNAAVTARGGVAAGDLSGLPAAIASIPSGGGELPVLTDPAAAGDVIAGKEYIDGAGAKQTGSLVVCDTVEVVETVGRPGVGLEVEIESTAQGGSAILTLPETNLLPENIKSGVNIFNVDGSAKTMRVESGTITPAEDTKSITIPCTGGAKAFILEATDDVLSAVEGQSLIYAVAFAGNFMKKHNIADAVNTAMTVWYKTQYASSGISAQNSGGVTLSLNFNFYPGTYRWEAYYWEDT